MPALRHLFTRIAESRVLESRHLSAEASTITSFALGRLHLSPRQQNGGLPALPYYYQYGGPSPGAVAGIVLGSVAGFLLLIWLFWGLSNGSGFFLSSSYSEEDIEERRRSRSPRSYRSTRRTQMVDRSPVRRERVIRQERIVRESNGPREPSRIRETVIVDDLPRSERRVAGDDMVEVIEEHSSIGEAPPPRRDSRRSGRGYRSVDPNLYAGGDYPQFRV